MFEDIYKNKKVLITGNTGFKGAWLTIWLLKLGANVYGYSKDIPTNPSLFDAIDLESKINHVYGDVRDYTLVKKTFDDVKPDFVFHLAAQPIVSTSFNNPIETYETNIMGTVNVLEAFRKINHESNLIVITSDKCYYNVEWTYGYRENDRLGGKDPYSASKAGAEIVFSSYFKSFYKSDSNKHITSARAGNVIGGGDWATNRIVPDAITSWASKKSVEIRSPYATRPWQHVLEPLSGYLRLGQLMKEKRDLLNGESFNFGPAYNQNHTVLELLNKISENWFSKNNMFNTGISINAENTILEANLLKLNCDKSLHALDWEPVLNFEKTTEFTGNWYYEFYFNNPSKQSLFSYTLAQIDLFESLAQEKKISWATNKNNK